MKKFTTFACLSLVMVLALSAMAADVERVIERPQVWSQADARDLAGNGLKATLADTFLLMGPGGSGAPYQGDWEMGPTLTSNLFTSEDVTEKTSTHFNISTYMQEGEDFAAWCGEMFDRCTPEDSLGGYGNTWHDLIELRQVVPNALISTTITVAADLQIWSEPGYDYTYLSRLVNNVAGFDNANSWDGPIMSDVGYGALQGPQAIEESFTYQPGEYVNSNEVAISFRFKSDGGWSDEDCEHPSSNTAGGCQVDNIVVQITNGGTVFNYSDDFDLGGTLGDPLAVPPLLSDFNWGVGYPSGAGDFTKIWSGLEDDDPCGVNYTNQVAWIDDGIVVPGTGGSECITWCYGPNGYVVNHTGGLAGGDEHVHNYAISPPMDWPYTNHDGMTMWFNIYRHEENAGNSTGVVYRVRTRTADVDSGETLEDATWWNTGNWIGGPDYMRNGDNWTAALTPGRDLVQIEVGCWELGWAWGQAGTDGTPAPYFDNIRIVTYPVTGPAFGFAEGGQVQDNFPEIDIIDYADLSANSVRFDMGWSISPPVDDRNDPGDSIVINCVAARSGAELVDPPAMHWTLLANPLFNAARTATPPNPLMGVSDSPDGFCFDFPDTGFLFPGDRLQYYYEASDAIDGLEVQSNTLPANLDGYGDFSDPLAWDTRFQIQCMPTMTGTTVNDQPDLLLWNDFGFRGGEEEWFGALSDLGLTLGVDYDVYHTNRPDNGAGNGLGGRATVAHITGYNDMLYTAGDMSYSLISNGDITGGYDPGDDIGLMMGWLGLGDRDLYVSGDDLALDMANSGVTTELFLAEKMGVTHLAQSIIDNIGGQATPLVVAEAYNAAWDPNDPLLSWGQPVFTQAPQWIAYGGCFSINKFDGVEALPGALRMAQFASPDGVLGAYDYSAATLNIDAAGNRVISMPYDFIYIYSDPSAKAAAPKAARVRVLSDILNYFGVGNNPGNVVGVPNAKAFAVFQNEPNPFNPVTKIRYVMPRNGHLTMKVYNVRGQLVKTLIDETVAATDNGEVIWDGTNNQGGSVSSGVYFYETRTVDGTVVNKMALVK